MSRVLPILFMFLSTGIYSQVQLYGKYCSIPLGESDVTCVDFLENNRFKYLVSGCLGLSSIGEGRYELKNSTLKLFFNKIEQQIKSKVSITESPSISNQEVTFEFNIKDQNGEPVFVLCY